LQKENIEANTYFNRKFLDGIVETSNEALDNEYWNIIIYSKLLVSNKLFQHRSRLYWSQLIPFITEEGEQ